MPWFVWSSTYYRHQAWVSSAGASRRWTNSVFSQLLHSLSRKWWSKDRNETWSAQKCLCSFSKIQICCNAHPTDLLRPKCLFEHEGSPGLRPWQLKWSVAPWLRESRLGPWCPSCQTHRCSISHCQPAEERLPQLKRFRFLNLLRHWLWVLPLS